MVKMLKKRMAQYILGMEKTPDFFKTRVLVLTKLGFNLNYSGFSGSYQFTIKVGTCFLVNTGMCHSLTLNLIIRITMPIQFMALKLSFKNRTILEFVTPIEIMILKNSIKEAIC